MALSWQGAPNQPLMLLQAPTFVPGQNFGNGLVVDLDLTSYTIVFSGLLPGGFPYMTLANGSALQVFSVPSSLAGGTARVQGVILDATHACSGPVGLMTTASFAIQF